MTLYMLGVAWFVQVVHYPLFAEVGRDSFLRYHSEHSRRTTLVVAIPMIIELATSIWLGFDPPTSSSGDSLQTLAITGAILAALTWAVTFAGAVPAHSRMGDGFDSSEHKKLMRSNLARTLIWSAHAAVVIALLAGVG